MRRLLTFAAALVALVAIFALPTADAQMGRAMSVLVNNGSNIPVVVTGASLTGGVWEQVPAPGFAVAPRTSAQFVNRSADPTGGLGGNLMLSPGAGYVHATWSWPAYQQQPGAFMSSFNMAGVFVGWSMEMGPNGPMLVINVSPM